MTVKMWFPGWLQWIAIWAGFALTAFASITDGWAAAMFVAIATVLIVWMLEGIRRKRGSNGSI